MGICLERSVDMVVGLLGDPQGRRRVCAARPELSRGARGVHADRYAGPGAGHSAGAPRAAAALCGHVLCLDRDAPSDRGAAGHRPAPVAATAESLAYVIYTSGSTARPRACFVPHATRSSISWHGTQAGFASGGRVAQSPQSASTSPCMEICPRCARQERLVDRGRRHAAATGRAFAAFIQDRAITTLFVPNVVLQHLAQAVW